MAKPLKSRIEALETNKPRGDHEYTADIGWDDEDCHYYKDGQEISRAQYFREAPHNQPIDLVWREIIPAWRDPDKPDLWHLDREMAGEPITWDEIERRYPENAKLQITGDKIIKVGAASEG